MWKKEHVPTEQDAEPSPKPFAELAGKVLYHYTTYKGILGITESRSIWASSVRHLNDTAEVKYACDLVTAHFERVLPKVAPGNRERFEYVWSTFMQSVTRHTNVFVASLSEVGDSLSQWRAYGGDGIGVSLGFDAQMLATTASSQKFRLVQCIYDLEKQESIVADLVEPMIAYYLNVARTDYDGQGHERFAEIAPVFKDSAFEGEREWRLIREGKPMLNSDAWMPLGKPSESSVKYRTNKSLLIPYIDFDLSRCDTNDRGKDCQAELVDVVVGPSPHAELNRESVVRLLESRGFDGGAVRSSAIPYRSW